MKVPRVSVVHIVVSLILTISCFGLQQVAYAQPFGVGLFGEDVPFGSETSLSIALSSNANLTLTPSGGTFSGNGAHTVTVTSLDVVGYDLYVNTTSSTAMTNGIDTIPASLSTNPAPLTINRWGYNTTGSTVNFKGMTASQALLSTGVGPFKNGVSTNVTYGAYIDTTKSSGTYSVNVTYTAIGRT